ncbi:cytochrome P450 [Thioalkalivibrio paradoxus]|uniref:Cytochrome P450 n=1 Tax=Thioalkalivibrio paradoxus ARh 1 TaxID=713585 RepID=W0DQQ2_9GAMM|nr:cytochrome P450 [Thioalkalivibrio paradoxus]AHE99165.1 cytochrome P450 [Thioalkalivibrio paradoxus ARh 1]
MIPIPATPATSQRVFDPRSPELVERPYDVYRHLRDEDPVHRSPFGMWVLSRYEDVYRALRDPRLSSKPSRYSVHAAHRNRSTPAAIAAQHMIMFLDAPEHTRLRGLLARVITDNLAANMRERIQKLVDDLLEGPLERGEMDIVRDLAIPLPLNVIAELLGIPAEDRSRLKEWSNWFFQIFSPVVSEEGRNRLNHAILEFREYLGALASERRRSPRQDIVSSLIAVSVDGDRLTDDEIFTSCLALFSNGQEALSHLVGNGMLALLQHPEQMRRLREDPGMIRNAVEELLRYDTPAQTVGRTATEAIELHGKVIPAGAPVYLLIGSANRDPCRFPNPDILDLSRPDCRHLSFGTGPHACLGAGLARVEAQAAILTLLTKTQDMELCGGPPTRLPNIFVRGLEALPVRFRAC